MKLTKRKSSRFYTAIQKMIMEELPAFYLVHEQKIVAIRSNVQGIRDHRGRPVAKSKRDRACSIAASSNIDTVPQSLDGEILLPCKAKR